MTELSDLRGRHQGETVYIVASGPTLDRYDLDFLGSETTIGVNWAFRHINHLTYQITKHHETAESCLAETKATISLVSRKNSSHTKPIESLESHARVVMFDHPPSNKSGPVNWSADRVDDDVLMVSWSTITSAMHLAALMGARTAVLVGYDGGVFPNKRNVEGYQRRSAPDLFHKHRYWAFVDQTLEARSLLEAAFPIRFISLSPFLGLDLEGTSFIGRFRSINLSRAEYRRARFDKALFKGFAIATSIGHKVQLKLQRARRH